MTSWLSADTLDLAAFIKPGDAVVCGQGPAEPLTLSEALVAQRHAIGRFGLFLGCVFSDTFPSEAADVIDFRSYGAIGTTAKLAKADALDVVPSHYRALPALFAAGTLRADVVLLQVSRDGAGGLSLGAVNDYTLDAARRARVVIAEVNEATPWTFGAELPADLRIDFCVASSRPLLALAPGAIGETEQAIARHVARLIPDGATIQIGIGAIPDAILDALRDRRDLGIHSGLITDRILDLIQAGAVTNARKPVDRGKTVTNIVLGTERLYRHVDRNEAVQVRPINHTHSLDIVARMPDFIAINSAVEVDLTGQVNAEFAGGAYVGGVGGQGDFVRGASLAPGGRSVIAMPSTARGGTMSRVVNRLAGGMVTTARSDADTIVTEWGVAELRGRSINERISRMIEIADPAFRDQLSRRD